MLLGRAARESRGMNAPLTRLSAEALNRGCACRTLDPVRLRGQLETDASLAGLVAEIGRTRPHLLSTTAAFVSAGDLHRIEAVVAALERVVALPRYRQAALERAPAIARREFGPRGVFLGFDFHLSAAGPRLIEINTNAGGALINAALARAQAACCTEVDGESFFAPTDLRRFEEKVFAMFRDEWRLQRGDAPLARVAIVDDRPEEQYLFPEFRLFQCLLERFGVQAAIVDAQALGHRDGRLWHDAAPIDLVYNRLTDFYLEEPAHAALRAAYDAGNVAVTPHPRAHALYADKRNLLLLSDAQALAELGVAAADRALLLAHVPKTELVGAASADRLWRERRGYFFKPATGYGSKAAYRGDKLTKRVWNEVLAGQYVAQALVPPSERVLARDGARDELKLDIRAYAYAGRAQLLAARLYQGQTTNFRTPGGGFAPVFVVKPPAAVAAA
jgi:glutathione synthase/RimK-type ligase-like ATP-grasp enzyme